MSRFLQVPAFVQMFAAILFAATSPAARAQPCTSPPAGLVAYWSGDNDARDLVGANDGVIRSGVNRPVAGDPFGLVGPSFRIQGGDYMAVPEFPEIDTPGGSFTVVTWVYSTNSCCVHYFGKRSGCGGGDFWQVFNPQPVPANQWTQIALTNDGSAGISRLCEGFNGWMDEVMVFNRALTQSELRGLRNATAGLCWDSDSDAVLDRFDNCPYSANTSQTDTDGDGLGDPCDNSPAAPNADQNDGDGDGIGDASDACLDRYPALVSWWTGENGASDLISGNDGVLRNGAVAGDSWARVGSSFRFQGGGYLAVPEFPEIDTPGGSFTVVTWVYSTNSCCVHYFGKRSGCGGGDFWQVFNPPVPAHQWTQIALTNDGSAGISRLWVNAAFAGQGGALPTNDAELRFGKSGDCEGINGWMDEIMVFNRVVTQEELRGLIHYGTFAPDANNDGTGDACENNSPVANAGEDQTVGENTAVFLDGSGSHDPDSDPLSYAWTQLAGDPATLDLTDPVRPAFIAPFVALGGATLTFQLTVSDGELASASAIVNITVTNVNHAPIAHAGVDQTVAEGAPVTLDASATYDPDLDPLTYTWTQTAGFPVMLDLSDPIRPAFTAPWVITDDLLVFELTADDGLATGVDTVTVLVEFVNHTPIADAGPDQTRNEGVSVMLDGTASSDPDADALTFAWTQVGGPAVTLDDPFSPTPSFTAPLISQPSVTLTFALTVDDGYGGSATDEVVITVLDTNAPPACDLARASSPSLWPPNHRMVCISIHGVGDPDDDPVSIAILSVTQDEPINGQGDGDTAPDAVIQGSTALVRAERSGHGNGRVYRITFLADDGQGGTCTGHVTVAVPHNRNAPCTDDGQTYDSTAP